MTLKGYNVWERVIFENVLRRSFSV